MNILIKSLISIIIVLLLDIIWLNINHQLYNGMIKGIQFKNITINIYGAIIAYILMFMSFYFIIYPNINSDKNKNVFQIALKHGALSGLILYGIYNFTNYSILENYKINISIIDTLWGTFVYFIAVFITIIISRNLK